MRIVIENVKDMIIPFIVAILLLTMFLTYLVPEIGNQAADKMVETKYEEYQDIQVSKVISERTKPEIKYNNSKQWKKGELISISQAFTATDADGAGVDLYVLKITDSSGNDVMEKYHKEEHAITFDTAGIYYFELQSTDREKKKNIERIALAVDN